MKTIVSKTSAMLGLFVCCLSAWAQTGPTASVTAINFTYTANSVTPPKTTNTNPFTVTLPSSLSGQTMVVTTASQPQGWLSVTPTSGTSPLVLTVTVNPTTLDPGNHSGTIKIDTKAGSGNPAVVLVTIAIASAPPQLRVDPLSLSYVYQTGNPVPDAVPISVGSTGDVIPFTVTVANAASSGSSGTKTPVWLRVSQTGLPFTLTTSGVALSGSDTRIWVKIDDTILKTLDPVSSPYGGIITFTPTGSTASAISPVTVTVSLQVLPGPTSLRLSHNIFPERIPAAPAVNPVFTLYGDNFFSSTGVTIQQPGGMPIAITGKNLNCIGRTVIQMTVASSYFVSTATGEWTVTVQNALQAPSSTSFTVTDPSLPIITSVVNAASYLPTAVQTIGANSLQPGDSSVSPREIIAIFGRNLGPSSVAAVSPTDGVYPNTWPPAPAMPVQVEFADANGVSFSPPSYAPLILVSSTQINCVVPVEVNGSSGALVTVRVSYNSLVTPDFVVYVLPEDPGVFTFGGVGQGQAAVLNFDSSTGAYTVNSAKTQAARNSAVVLFVTGTGDLDPGAGLANGAVAPSAIRLADPTTVRVDIDGQPAVVTYAGTSTGAVAGLIQINAIVPLAAKASGADSLTVSIGNSTFTRRSQPGVTIGVK